MTPQPLVTCPNEAVGTDDVRWLMVAAIASRTRTDRLAAAKKVVRSRSRLISKEHRALMHGIVSGDGDELLKKALEHGYDGDWNKS